MQSFEHLDVISMIDKSRDHEILSSIFIFYGNIDAFESWKLRHYNTETSFGYMHVLFFT